MFNAQELNKRIELQAYVETVDPLTGYETQAWQTYAEAFAKVEPLVGRIALDGFKDASAIYAYALKQKGIACDGVNEAGLAQLVTMAASQSKRPQVALDSAMHEPSALTSRFRKA